MVKLYSYCLVSVVSGFVFCPPHSPLPAHLIAVNKYLSRRNLREEAFVLAWILRNAVSDDGKGMEALSCAASLLLSASWLEGQWLHPITVLSLTQQTISFTVQTKINRSSLRVLFASCQEFVHDDDENNWQRKLLPRNWSVAGWTDHVLRVRPLELNCQRNMGEFGTLLVTCKQNLAILKKNWKSRKCWEKCRWWRLSFWGFRGKWLCWELGRGCSVTLCQETGLILQKCWESGWPHSKSNALLCWVVEISRQ